MLLSSQSSQRVGEGRTLERRIATIFRRGQSGSAENDCLENLSVELLSAEIGKSMD